MHMGQRRQEPRRLTCSCRWEAASKTSSMTADDKQQERPPPTPQERRAQQATKEHQETEKVLGLKERLEQKQVPAEVQATHQRMIQNGWMKAPWTAQPLSRSATGEPPMFRGRLMAVNVR